MIKTDSSLKLKYSFLGVFFFKLNYNKNTVHKYTIQTKQTDPHITIEVYVENFFIECSAKKNIKRKRKKLCIE